jgi:DNA-binding transcriptional LysR family regulator
MLNPAWLKTFKTLVEIGHFTQTAEILFMTQPGVSQHIKKLENACGYALIKRINKSFEVTEQGKRVYDYAVKTQLQQSDLLESLSFDNPFAGTCKVSCSGTTALWLYPMLIELQTEHPELHTQLEVAPNQRILESVAAGHTDLGIVTDKAMTSNVVSEHIGEEPLCLVLPSAAKKETLTAEYLTSIGLVSHPDALHYLRLYLGRCQDDALTNLNPESLKIVSYINQLNQILLPISEGIGFTVLPQSAIAASPLVKKLYVYQQKANVSETLYLIKKQHRELPTRYTNIEQRIRQHVENKR